MLTFPFPLLPLPMSVHAENSRIFFSLVLAGHQRIKILKYSLIPLHTEPFS